MPDCSLSASGFLVFMVKSNIRKPLQDRTTATWWLCDAIAKAKALSKPSGTVAYIIFTERMIKNKFRIQQWHLEYIGEKFNFKPQWAIIKYEGIYPQHK